MLGLGLAAGGLVLAAFVVGCALADSRVKPLAQVALTVMLAAVALAPAAVAPCALVGFLLVVMVGPQPGPEAEA